MKASWWIVFALVAVALVASGGTAFAAISSEADTTGGTDSDGTWSNEGAMATSIGASSGFVVDGAACWRTSVVVCADGAPGAYAPNNSGLDYTANAGRPGNWWGVVTDSRGVPIVTSDGSWVSTTALVDPSFPASDQRRYVNASEVNYLAIGPDVLAALGAAKGDLCIAANPATGAVAGAIVGDIAPHGAAHEASIALCDALGIDSDPRRGGGGPVQLVIFAGSSSGWPRESYQADALERFNAWGGVDRLTSLVGA